MMRILSKFLLLIAFSSSLSLFANANWLNTIPDFIEDVTGVDVAAKVLDSIDYLCSLATKVGFDPDPPDLNDISFVLITKCKNFSYEFSKVTDMVKNPAFKETYPTFMFVPGWMNSITNSLSTDILRQAFLCRGGNNFIVVDLNKYLKTLYTWASANTVVTGEHMAQALKILFTKYPKLLSLFYLIGHSLGAQVVGCAGRELQIISPLILPIIIGLDPANPCFNDNKKGIKPISATDATFVLLIHSNIKVLGEYGPDGIVDIYSNGENSFQPGCGSLSNLDPSCSHHRCVYYLAESLYSGNKCNFIATKCRNMEELKHEECSGETIPVGIFIPRNTSGIFNLPVNPSQPFGKNAYDTNFDSDKLKCYLCPDK